MRRTLIATLSAVLVLPCSCARTSTDRPAMDMVTALYAQAMMEQLAVQPALVRNVCTFYFRLHGRWPTSAAELKGTPLADGSPFDPRPYQPMAFKVVEEGAVTVWYDWEGRRSAVVVIRPQAASRPSDDASLPPRVPTAP